MENKEKSIEIYLDNMESFEFNGNVYCIESAVKNDIASIIREANESHPESNDIYDFGLINIVKSRLYCGDDGNIVYMYMVYKVPYKEHGSLGHYRFAVGQYYPVHYSLKDTKGNVLVLPHPYQGSMCW